MGTPMTGGQAVVAALAAHGVEVVFGIPGVHTLAIYDALVDAPMQHVLARHEQGAGFMADGFARASGRPGVAIVITGPGVTNVATAVGEAYTDSSPVLVVASSADQQVAGQMAGHLHDLQDQIGLMRHVTAWSGRATEPKAIPGLVAEAFSRMASGRPRPTYVDVPLDVLTSTGESEMVNATAPVPREPATAAIDSAIAAVSDANRVVVYCGGGAVTSGAADAVIGLAERLGAPVLTSQMGKGSVPEDHPLALGNLWEQGNAVESMLREADLAIVVGSKLGGMETNGQAMPLPEQIIRIDIDPGEVARHYPPTHTIVADAAATAAALLAGLDARKIRKTSWTAEAVATIKAQALAKTWGQDQVPYLQALRRAIPRDGILVNDMTMMSYLACRHYPVYEPRTFLSPAGYATLGFSLPAAIGAKLARPEATVVPIVGDGGFQFSMQELATAIQYRLGLPIVIFNDATYTAVKEAQAREQNGRFIAVDLVNPDFVALAGAYGIPGVCANSPDELEAAVTAAASRDLPTIIETPIRIDF